LTKEASYTWMDSDIGQVNVTKDIKL